MTPVPDQVLASPQRRGDLDLAALGVAHPDPFIATLRIGDASLGRAIPHVDNTQYVKWLDRVAELHSDSLGFTRQRLAQDNVMWFVARHEIDYHAEVWPDDTLTLITWVRDMRRVKSWRDYVIYRESDATIVCRAATLWVLVDLDTRRPCRVPIEMAEAFAPIEIRV